MGEEKKIFWKHWSGILVLAIVAALIILLLTNLGEVINVVQGRYLAYKEHKQLEALQKPYKNDKYGGKTPEETFDLFIAALKKEDVDLASKYFVIPKQESWRKSLAQIKKANLFGEMLTEMEYAKSNSIKTIEENQARFSYALSGKYGTEIIFEKIFGLWKISQI